MNNAYIKTFTHNYTRFFYLVDESNIGWIDWRLTGWERAKIADLGCRLIQRKLGRRGQRKLGHILFNARDLINFRPDLRDKIQQLERWKDSFTL